MGLRFRQSLAELAEGRTTIVIADWLATIRHADRIFVLTEEGIAEAGTHAGLVAARNSLYANLTPSEFVLIGARV